MRKIYQRSLYKKSYWFKKFNQNELPRDLTSKNHNHNSFDQRLKWIQLPKITTLWSETPKCIQLPKITTLWSEIHPNASNFPKSQHFDQRHTQMHPISQNHNTLIRDTPKCIQLPKITTLWSETPKCIQFPKITTLWWERERGGKKNKNCHYFLA
jgi:hypothetical protein